MKLVKLHNQEMGFDGIKTESISIYIRSLHLSFSSPTHLLPAPSLSSPLTTVHLVSISVILSSQEYYANGTIQYETFGVFFFQQNSLKIHPNLLYITIVCFF